MLTEELIRKVRRIEWVARKRSRDVLSGTYHSAFKGQGIEFAGVREYVPGDDVRFIDWNVSGRSGRLQIKEFIEERELTVMLLVDLSASQGFFSGDRSKKEVAAEIAALLAFTAQMNHDKVGALLFTDRVESWIPPRKGRTHLLRLVREVLDFQPQSRGTDLGGALSALNRVLKKRSILFLLSDFWDRGYEIPLRMVARRHEVIALQIQDDREVSWPMEGLVRFRDAETGKTMLVDASSRRFQEHLAVRLGTHQKAVEEGLARQQVDHVLIPARGDYEKALFRYFERRKRRHR